MDQGSNPASSQGTTQDNKSAASANEMAAIRTVLALDRTLLAWIRTSLTLIGFGFTLARFVHDLMNHGQFKSMKAIYPRQLGIALILMGVGTLLGGALEFMQLSKRVNAGKPGIKISVSLVLAILLVCFSVALVANFLTELA